MTPLLALLIFTTAASVIAAIGWFFSYKLIREISDCGEDEWQKVKRILTANGFAKEK